MCWSAAKANAPCSRPLIRQAAPLFGDTYGKQARPRICIVRGRSICAWGLAVLPSVGALTHWAFSLRLGTEDRKMSRRTNPTGVSSARDGIGYVSTRAMPLPRALRLRLEFGDCAARRRGGDVSGGICGALCLSTNPRRFRVRRRCSCRATSCVYCARRRLRAWTA